jgi:hypothetical protein
MNKKIAHILILGSLILLGFNIYETDFSHIKRTNILGMLTNILLILAMIFTIRDLNKNKK